MHRTLLQISVTGWVEAEEAIASLMERLFRQTPALYTDEETLVTKVSVYLAGDRLWTEARRAALRRGLARIRAGGLAVGPGRISVRRLRPDGWADSWKRHFKPIEIGPALLVKPTWSRRRPRSGQAVVTLDPGLSFGTGQHPTTSFCLEQVVARRALPQPPSFLDAGTGSGILAIAAAKLGYAPITAFDYDPTAVRIAKANARANGVGPLIRILTGDVRRPPLPPRARFHLVGANLLAELLIEQAPRIARWVRPDGRLVLAGVLDRQFAGVQAAYQAQGMELVAERLVREWRSGAFRWTKHKKKLQSVEH